jgi:hypothetical protein
MRRRIPGLHQQSDSKRAVPEGILLVSVHRVLYINGQKPYFAVAFKVIEPAVYAGQQISTRLYSTERALWKLQWFLQEFRYDPKLLDQDEIDEKALLGLRGVVKISRASVNGRTFTNLDAFAPETAWSSSREQQLAHDDVMEGLAGTEGER